MLILTIILHSQIKWEYGWFACVAPFGFGFGGAFLLWLNQEILVPENSKEVEK